MYRLLFFFLTGFPAACFSQVISIQDGLYSDPDTWSCHCVPQGPEDITIHHEVVLDTDLFPGGGCVLTIETNGSLTENQPYQIQLDGAILRNKGSLSISGVVSAGPHCDFWNTGDANVFSWIVNATNSLFYNTGSCSTHHLLNDGVVLNTGTLLADLVENHNDVHTSGLLASDSVFTDYLFVVQSGICEFGALLNTAQYSAVESTITVERNMHLNGSSDHWGNNLLSVGGNLTFAAAAHFEGQAIVAGDLYVDATASLDGSGGICVGGHSENAGTVAEIYFCDQTGGDFDVNTGTIDADVAFCSNGNCGLGIAEAAPEIALRPNPAADKFTVKAAVPVESVELYSLTGELIARHSSPEVRVDAIAPGMYLVGINGDTTALRRLIVQ